MVGAARGVGVGALCSWVRLSALVARRASVLGRVLLDGSLLRHRSREAVSGLTSAGAPLGPGPLVGWADLSIGGAIYAAVSAFLHACCPSGMN